MFKLFDKKQIVIFIIKLYQKFLSPIISRGACRFTPTCSQYMIESIEKKGLIRGIYKGVRRIMRCHPWNKKDDHWDPVN